MTARVTEALAVAAPILFLLMLRHSACGYALEESFVIAPAKEIPGSRRASALPVGLLADAGGGAGAPAARRRLGVGIGGAGGRAEWW